MLVSGLRPWFFSIHPHGCSGLGQSLGPSLVIEIGFMTGPYKPLKLLQADILWLSLSFGLLETFMHLFPCCTSIVSIHCGIEDHIYFCHISIFLHSLTYCSVPFETLSPGECV